jgi:GTP cyclohydrolase I
VIDREAAARAIEAFLRALGHEPVGELAGTGERVAEAWASDLLQGTSIDAGALLRAGSIERDASTPAGLVIVRELDVSTMCPHHLLPAQGTATIAYLPGARLVGLGTIAGVVDACSRRLTLQERIGETVVEHLVSDLGARGALCKLSLVHACLRLRGERKASSVVETVALAGSFAAASVDRDLALAALR